MPPVFITSFLPLRAAVIKLRFTAATQLPLYHPPILTAFLRSLIEDENAYAEFLWIDAPESGGQWYAAGDGYRFTLYMLPGGETMFNRLLCQLRDLPDSVVRHGEKLPLRDNLAWVQASDLFSGQAISAAADLTHYDTAHLAAEVMMWQNAPLMRARFLTPLRILRNTAERGATKGEARFCRELEDVSYALLRDRLFDALADLARRRGVTPSPRDSVSARALNGDLFWIDAGYRDADGDYRSMGGVQGLVEFTAPLPEEELALWVLGQYLGFGQRRAFGWGRYRLESSEGDYTLCRAERAAPLLTQVAQLDNLRTAHRVLADHQQQRAATQIEETADWDAAEIESELDAERLTRLCEKLAAHTYQPALLRGVLVAKKDGGVRPLAVPPFWDRVAQRACAQFLSAGLEDLFYHGSFGYRLGRSRHLAKDQVERWYADGYRWVYESDIEAFFDQVQWAHLHLRLTALLDDDPLVDLLMAWMAAPVEYQGEVIQRRAGLPQGSPLSPVLANLLLDDFDRDLVATGCKLAHSGKQLLVLCRNKPPGKPLSSLAKYLFVL